MVTPEIAHQFFEALDRAERILIVSHPRPDGDTLGANCAIATYLRDAGKEVVQFCTTPASSTFWYLPSVHLLTDNPDVFNDAYDIVCVVDAGDLGYAGITELLTHLPKKPFIVNVDHHATNTNYGDLNIVFPKTSSTVEVVWELFSEGNKLITKQIATCLLTGLITDTGNFANAATTASVFQACAELMLKGAPATLIHEALFKSQSLTTLQLWGRAMQRMKTFEGGIVATWVTKDDLIACNASESDTEGTTRILSFISSATFGLVLYETDDGNIKGSLRTQRSDVNVAEMAQLFGGGGHIKAAGFTTSGPLTEARIMEIVSILQKKLKTVH
ncbi:MAG: bifunctional oligoribonuclease/PAP phosphatase NrnA [bacterium]|nr:bifunctional oligoribonuclease/PAP phosphatase NrnA [bacterium]